MSTVDNPSAQRLGDVDSDEVKRSGANTLVARPAILYIKDIPVMWLPFLFSDMRPGRHSGILTPRFGVSDPFNPADNVLGGVRYMRYLLDLFNGDSRLALAAYNAGENAVLAARSVPPYPETRRYVARILKMFGGKKPLLLPALPKTVPVALATPQPIHSYTDAAGVVHFTDGAPPGPQPSPTAGP